MATHHTPSSGTPSAHFFTATVVVVPLLLVASVDVAHVHVAAAAVTEAVTSTTVPVHVGVILDLATQLGKKSLLSVEMALEDFYAAHPDFTTRVRLHVRDSNRDVVTAASAALDLIRDEKVSVVIGPQSALQAEFVTYLANKTKVPVISFSATRDALAQYHVPYFLRACAKDSSQAASIAAFVQSYGWKNVVVVYEDDNYGAGILPSITDALQDVESHVIYRSAIPASSPDYCIDKELYKLMSMQTRVFIVHLLPAHASHFFARASAAGMMTEGYVWIVTDNVGIVLDVLPEQTTEYMQGVVGFKPYVSKSARILDFTTRFVTLFRAKYLQDHDVRMARPTVFQFWAYDVAWAVATAVEKSARLPKGFQAPEYAPVQQKTVEHVGKSLVDDLPTSPAGQELLTSILEENFDGLAGNFTFVGNHMHAPVYEVINLIGEKAKRIGFWSLDSGLSRVIVMNSSANQGHAELNIRPGQILKPVIWPGYSTAVPKGWDLPVNAKKLKIGVPVRHDFKFLVNVETSLVTNRSSISGYSIDVFDAAVKKLPYALRYDYVPVVSADYDELISQVYFKMLDAAVGDVTIIFNRSKYVDFTMPYTESGVSMLVLANNNDKLSMWIFLEPLTKDLWIATIVYIFFTGVVVWMMEHPTNQEFQGSKLRQFSTAFYFAFSTLTFSHDQIIKQLRSKVVVVIWCFVVLVLVQSYTASLSSLLTAKRLQPSVTDPRQLLVNGDFVGYQNGSFVLARLKQLGVDERKIKVFTKIEEYAKALRDGSKNGGVSAIFDEIPYLNNFLAQYGQEFQVIGPVDRTDGFGFVFPRGSPLVPDLSRAILNLTEGCEGSYIERKWFGVTLPSFDNSNPDTSSTRLSLRSFKGLFIINGFVLSIMLLIHLLQYIYAKYCTDPGNASPDHSHGSGGTASDNEPQQSQDGMGRNEEDASDNEPQQLLAGVGRSEETASENEPQQL